MSLNHGYSYTLRLAKDALGHTVVSYLSLKFQHSSSNVWQERLEQGQLWLNGCSLDHDADLRPGQVLVWQRPAWQEDEVPLNFELIYEDASLLVVSKPSGLPTMPAGGFLNKTLYTLVRDTYPEARPLHRLGRGTSGLVVFARSQKAFSSLSQQWQQRQVTKEYLALASAKAKHTEYAINTPIGKVSHTRLGEVYAAHPEGKPAFSRARVLTTRPTATLFKVNIETGRPHQIRIHLASINHPLLGDPLYGLGGLPVSEALPGDGGYFLHASLLEFLHPERQHTLQLRSELPKDFQEHLKAYQLV